MNRLTDEREKEIQELVTERDQLRAEVEGWKVRWREEMQEQFERRSQLRAEVERLRAEVFKAQCEATGHWKESDARGELVAKLRAALKEARDALEQVKQHCLCNRNVIGFDYGEVHRKLGKPKMGARWLSPEDICEHAIAKLKALGGEK